MKRKLIKFEVFEKMKEDSLSVSMKELVEAEEHLARALSVGDIRLNSFDESSAIYETSDGNFLRANYTIDKKKINFDNVEELVIDQESEKNESRKLLGNMLEAILDDKDTDAQKLFDKYIDIASGKRKREGSLCDESLQEGYTRLYGTRGKGGQPKIFHRVGSKDPRKVEAARKAHQKHPDSYAKGGRKRSSKLSTERKRRKNYEKHYGRLKALSGGSQYRGRKKAMTEWQNLATNVFNYIDHTSNGHIIRESIVNENNGNVSVTLPTANVRAEGKILQMKYDILKTDVKILRENARNLVNDQRFCQAIADVKRHNNLADNEGLEESIGQLVTRFPSVLYLTQEELAHVIHKSLDNVGVTNYDDQTCVFMAEGILRVAHEAYSERVDRIRKLANIDIKETDDTYMDFQTVVTGFFPTLDESTHLEMKMFEDLYNAAVDIRKIALESENEDVRNEAVEFITELEAVLSGQAVPSLELAAEVADWLEDLAEANIPGAGEEWNVVKTPHKTISGDHPQMAKNAKVPAIAGSYPGDWGDPAPMIGQDSNAWNHGDEARNRSWSNKGGDKVWPSLNNPLVPKPFGDYTMKGETGADKATDGLATWQSSDTVPEIKNPYLPASVIPKQKVEPKNGVE